MAEAISKPSIRKPPENPYAVLLKDAGLAALVALGVGAPLLGMQTVPGERGLALIPRPGLLLATVAAVFVGRFLLGLLLANRAGAARREAEAPPRIGPSPMARAGKLVAPALLAFSVLMPVIPGIGRYEIDLGTLVLTYVMLGWGLNIVVGLAGLLDLGYVAFYAVGAYGYAIMAKYFDLSFWAALPLTGLFAAAWGIILGFPVLRLRGDYLAIVTLAFGEIIRVVLLNWTTLTGGPNGMSGVPRPTFFGLPFSMAGGEGTFAGFFGLEPSALHRVTFLYYVILALALLTNFVTIRLRRHPVGRAWEALREDEIAARALGLSAVAVKLTAFATGAMFGGFAGAFFATRQGFISPESFTFIESALILAIVVLGGMGSQLGVAIAATLMIGGFEVFRGLEEFRMLVFGVAMVAIMVWRPRGLVSGREPSVSLGKRTNIGSEHVAEGKG